MKSSNRSATNQLPNLDHMFEQLARANGAPMQQDHASTGTIGARLRDEASAWRPSTPGARSWDDVAAETVASCGFRIIGAY